MSDPTPLKSDAEATKQRKPSAREGANADPRFRQLNQQVTELNATITKKNKVINDLQKNVENLGKQVMKLQEDIIHEKSNKEREIKDLVAKMEDVRNKAEAKLNDARKIEGEVSKLQRRLAKKQEEVEEANKLFHEAQKIKREADEMQAANLEKLLTADAWRKEGQRLHEQLRILSNNYKVLVANKRNGAINHAAEQLAPVIMGIDSEFCGKELTRDMLMEIARRLSTAYYGAEVQFVAQEMEKFDGQNIPEVQLDADRKLPVIEDPTKTTEQVQEPTNV